MTQIVRRQLLRAIIPAVRKLNRVARGDEKSRTIMKFVPASHLPRLTSIFVAAAADDRTARRAPEEELSPEREFAGLRFDWLHSLTQEQSSNFDRQREEALAAWEAQCPPPFKSAAEAMANYKTHGIHHISEVEESVWPAHLAERELHQGARI
jgi:hypothetical protein